MARDLSNRQLYAKVSFLIPMKVNSAHEVTKVQGLVEKLMQFFPRGSRHMPGMTIGEELDFKTDAS